MICLNQMTKQQFN